MGDPVRAIDLAELRLPPSRASGADPWKLHRQMSQNYLRDELCEAMRALARTAPQMRFAQLLAAAGELCSDLHGRGLWEAEDGELLEALWKLNRDLEQHAAPTAEELASPGAASACSPSAPAAGK